MTPKDPDIASCPVYVLQSVIDEMKTHGRENKSHEVCGVLIGNLCLSPEGKWMVVVDGRIEGKYASYTLGSVTFTDKAWTYINEQLDAHYPQRRIVGWYHTHPNFGIFLSSADMFIHTNFFNLKWQPAYVFDPIRETDGWFLWNEKKPVPSKVTIVKDYPSIAKQPKKAAANPQADASASSQANPPAASASVVTITEEDTAEKPNSLLSRLNNEPWTESDHNLLLYGLLTLLFLISIFSFVILRMEVQDVRKALAPKPPVIIGPPRLPDSPADPKKTPGNRGKQDKHNKYRVHPKAPSGKSGSSTPLSNDAGNGAETQQVNNTVKAAPQPENAGNTGSSADKQQASQPLKAASHPENGGNAAGNSSQVPAVSTGEQPSTVPAAQTPQQPQPPAPQQSVPSTPSQPQPTSQPMQPLQQQELEMLQET